MEAKDYYNKNKRKRTIENEYFIAMDKEAFFKMMDDYADYKIRQHKETMREQVIESEY